MIRPTVKQYFRKTLPLRYLIGFWIGLWIKLCYFVWNLCLLHYLNKRQFVFGFSYIFQTKARNWFLIAPPCTSAPPKLSQQNHLQVYYIFCDLSTIGFSTQKIHLIQLWKNPAYFNSILRKCIPLYSWPSFSKRFL